eukprot:SAG31_NODE_22039_length_535_cov_0.933486_1_plen_133_part_10
MEDSTAATTPATAAPAGKRQRTEGDSQSLRSERAAVNPHLHEKASAASLAKTSSGELARFRLAEGVLPVNRRGVRVEVLRWFLDELTARGMPADTTTHDIVHGLGTKWSKELADASDFGFGYPPPTSGWSVRA